MRFFDTHAHMDDKAFREDRGELLWQAHEAGLALMVNVGFDLLSSQRSIALADEYPFVYASVGIHPHDAKTVTDETYEKLEKLASHHKVVAIGEMGLDYYRDLSPRNVQMQVFKEQLKLARKLKKPVIIHDRDAHGDIMDILDKDTKGMTGVLHCFSGSWEMARFCLERDFYISIAGPVTYTNARQLLEVAQKVPLERLLVETDSPYLSPHPLRGKRNDVSKVTMIIQKIAELRQEDAEMVAEQCLQNGCKLFGIPQPA
ncbi:TatD family deoxyribonuclease [Heliorestis acidaminivorans]|uniref:TatD family deoxyribonuclease n=1 Tax=Heliorestis acidaminivorans TaxID=553427 RepID=A0A6I0F344_9FIRM|nr:TatD family hydrolase [Heliorestis acidaminivorans]KAB2953016.1 TatD family deoxyribonuclease [Heliorestis acidaminivorans]